jgi:Ni,Fe-hydrogenase III small subunit
LPGRVTFETQTHQLTSPAFQKPFDPSGLRAFTVSIILVCKAFIKGLIMTSLFQKIFNAGIVTEKLGPGDSEIVELVQQVDQSSKKLLGRALAIREVDAGSCNGCEIEITGLTSPVYDSERFGIHFVASPRHADMLLVTGPVTRNMEVPLRKTYDATPDPKLVVAVGDCSKTCGVFKDSYAVAGSVDQIIPVDVFVHGCPPEPADILRGILTALDRAPKK